MSLPNAGTVTEMPVGTGRKGLKAELGGLREPMRGLGSACSGPMIPARMTAGEDH